MRNKIMLRTLSTAAAALACAVWNLAGCSSPSSSFEDDKNAAGKTPALTELSIGFVQAENLLAAKFAPGLTEYHIALDKEGQMEVSAAAGEQADVIIKIDGLTKEGASALFAAPAPGSSAVIIAVGAVWKKGGAEPQWYEITLMPAQTDDNADKTLSLLEATYQNETHNLFNTAFTQSSNQYTASLKTTDAGYKHGGGVIITASASSRKATVEIKYGNAALPLTQNADGSVSALVPALPGPGKSDYAEVKVTPGNHIGSSIYLVKIACVNRTVSWKGMVNYLGTEGFKIKDIIVQDVSGKPDSIFNAAIDVNKDLNMDGTSYPWTLDVEETYQPRYFTVKLEIKDENIPGKMIPYSTGRLEPVVGALEDSIDIVIAAGAVGNTISDANELFSKLGTPATANKNYSLANDIYLTQYVDEATGQPKAWVGPGGYNKTFFGNGHTIHGLDLSGRTGGDIGLFSTLGNGAVIQDFTVKATTGNVPLQMTGASHFGGVIGNPGNVTITIKNVTVTGTLHFQPVTGNNYLLCGGLIGEVQNSNGNITIINCVSELNIILEAGTSNSNQTIGFGGLVGKAYGKLAIDKSYATGDINVSHNGNRNIVAGGLVGEKNAGTLTITESYAAGKIIMNSTNPGTLTTIAGGLVGWFDNNPKVIIKNSAALNESVIAQVPAGKTYISHRIIAAASTSAVTAVSGGALEKNFARTDMIFGTDHAHPDIADNDLNGVDGESVNFEDFKLKETWMDPARLGWSEAHWDFSGLASGGWPQIKK